MTPGRFTDAGYRYQENLVDKQDSRLPFVNSFTSNHETFYDVKVFSSDTMPVGEDHLVISTMYFRVAIDRQVHTRVVYGLKEWLGALGGIDQVLMTIFCFFLSGYV